jgi:hypothetical protein
MPPICHPNFAKFLWHRNRNSRNTLYVALSDEKVNFLTCAQRERFFSDTFWTCGHRFFQLLDTPPAQIFWPDGQKIIITSICKSSPPSQPPPKPRAPLSSATAATAPAPQRRRRASGTPTSTKITSPTPYATPSHHAATNTSATHQW